MSVSLIVRHFYNKFSRYSIEDLENQLEKQKQKYEEMEKKCVDEKHCEHRCRQCISTFFEEDGAVITAEFSYDVCEACDKLNEEYSERLDVDPLLATHVLTRCIENIEAGIVSKQKEYEKLTDEELAKAIDENYSYGRYLRRCETNFDWDGKPVPIGLLKQMDENEEEEKALEFEQRRRKVVANTSIEEKDEILTNEEKENTEGSTT